MCVCMYVHNMQHNWYFNFSIYQHMQELIWLFSCLTLHSNSQRKQLSPGSKGALTLDDNLFAWKLIWTNQLLLLPQHFFKSVPQHFFKSEFSREIIEWQNSTLTARRGNLRKKPEVLGNCFRKTEKLKRVGREEKVEYWLVTWGGWFFLLLRSKNRGEEGFWMLHSTQTQLRQYLSMIKWCVGKYWEGLLLNPKKFACQFAINYPWKSELQIRSVCVQLEVWEKQLCLKDIGISTVDLGPS